MKRLNKATGMKGELQVQKFLEKQGYKILESNYACKLGEVDIIAKDNDYIVFIEVKTRNDLLFGRPCEAVTPYKQNKIRAVAKYYLMMKKQSEENVRFDVIEVLEDEINHIKNAF